MTSSALDATFRIVDGVLDRWTLDASTRRSAATTWALTGPIDAAGRSSGSSRTSRYMLPWPAHVHFMTRFGSVPPLHPNL